MIIAQTHSHFILIIRVNKKRLSLLWRFQPVYTRKYVLYLNVYIIEKNIFYIYVGFFKTLTCDTFENF